MTCASALSLHPDSAAALRELDNSVWQQLGAAPADIAVLFSSPHHAANLAEISSALRARPIAKHLLGVTGETIVGVGREVETEPALALWAMRGSASMRARPVRFEYRQRELLGWPEELRFVDQKHATMLALGDPFSFPTDSWLQFMAEQAPGLAIVGGLASGGHQPGVNRLLLDDQIHADGAVGLVLEGLPVRTVVSQGCRPIGRHQIVTRSQENEIQQLGRRPAIEVLQELYYAQDEATKHLMQTGLHLGVVINEYQESFNRGDFLARNVIGTTPRGGIVITDQIRVGRTVQFMVHDAQSADDDLRALLSDQQNPPARGALLFSCNGRGTRMFPAPNHDAAAIGNAFGPIPLAGFFAMGEIGPIGGQNFLHGFTASIALFG